MAPSIFTKKIDKVRQYRQLIIHIILVRVLNCKPNVIYKYFKITAFSKMIKENKLTLEYNHLKENID